MSLVGRSYGRELGIQPGSEQCKHGREQVESRKAPPCSTGKSESHGHGDTKWIKAATDSVKCNTDMCMTYVCVRDCRAPKREATNRAA